MFTQSLQFGLDTCLERFSFDTSSVARKCLQHLMVMSVLLDPSNTVVAIPAVIEVVQLILQ
jgi:hypothetical protein